MTATETLTREFQVELAAGDGRTLETRIVPYNIPTLVSDGGPTYQEMFLPGAFNRQLGAANRVFLNFEHQQGLGGMIGHGTGLDDRADALYGTFKVKSGSDGDTALEFVREGVLTGLSVEFRPEKTKNVDGVQQRVAARLDKVSLCRFPAYEDAQVLAVRTEPPPPATNPEVDRLLSQLGYVPLDETLTPDELAKAAARLNTIRRRDEKAAAARELVRRYHIAELQPPTNLLALART